MEWKKCKKCGTIQDKSHLRCFKCKGSAFELINASGKATLLTYTILTAPPKEYIGRKSYALGMVAFENGVKALGQLRTERNLKIGMEMEMNYEKICFDGQEIYAHIFYPKS